ncbi:hypothetical protein MMC18_001525 [Xylographa bjoerkii]|nr:hypothetical protein [Xylographa bjoerkii]
MRVLITAPRRSAAVPSPDGSYGLYTVSTYDLESHSETKEIRVLELETGITSLITNDKHNKNPIWFSSTQILWLREANGSATQIWIGTIGQVERNAYLAGIIPARIENLQIKELHDGIIAVAFTADAKPDGSLYNTAQAPRSHSSAREYDSVLVRFWDTYFTAEHSSLWYTTLQKPRLCRQYTLSDNLPLNALKGTPLTCPIWPSDPFSGAGFDISTTGLLVTARDPEFNPAESTQTSLWYIPLRSFTEDPAPMLRKLPVPGYNGDTSSVVFAPNGISAAFLKTKDGNDSSDLNRIFIVREVMDAESVYELPIRSEVTQGRWDLSPNSITWASNSHSLYVTADERGRCKLFRLVIIYDHGSPAAYARPLSEDGVISSVYSLSTSSSEPRLFINQSTFMESSIFALINPDTGAHSLISSATKMGKTLGLHASQVSEITFKGSGEYDVQAWVMKPSIFKADKKYPLAFLIHGGPADSWRDAWSTRWNPAIFAEQGYIVVLPNPTGSTSFGQAFSSAVNGDWGGRAYHDLAACFAHLESHLPFIDTTRAVALGASYGGYMINWIAGQPLAKKFRTLVAHDGCFSIYNMLSSDIATPLPTDMGGTLWKDKAIWDFNDPAQHTQNWTQPMLFIHSDLDYRCPVTEGLAPFAVCQQRGIESRFLNFPDENHFVLKHENSLKWHRTVLGWINKYVGVEGGVVLEPPVSEPHRGNEWRHAKYLRDLQKLGRPALSILEQYYVHTLSCILAHFLGPIDLKTRLAALHHSNRTSMMLNLHFLALALLLPMLTAASPLKYTKSCMADSLLMILQDNGNDAVSFCRGIAARVIVTATTTTTALWANTTITRTVVSQPMMTITIEADTVTTVTTTIICSEIGTPPHSTTAIASMLEPVIERRGIATPSYLSIYTPLQIASACGCLVVAGPTTTATSFATVTSVVPTTTEVYTVIGTPAVSITTIMATMTFVETVCLGGPTMTAMSEGPR